MVVKVLVRNSVGQALGPVAELRVDPSARVRAAAERAVVLPTAARA